MTHSDEKPLRELIAKIRKEVGLTQEQFAQQLGVTTRTVARWEHGESAPQSSAQKAALTGLATTAAPSLGAAVASGLGIAAVGLVPMVGAIGALGALATGAAAYLLQRNSDEASRKRAELRAGIEQAQRLLQELEQAAPQLASADIKAPKKRRRRSKHM